MKEQPTSVWIPTTKGAISAKLYRLSERLREYDYRLSLGWNNDQGEWCIFYCVSRMEPYLPVFGLGKEDEIPDDPDLVLQRVEKADALKLGTQILEEMRYKNDAAKEHLRRKADEGAWLVVEALEHYCRRTGQHPSPRVFMP